MSVLRQSLFAGALTIGSIIAICSSCGYEGSYRYKCQDPANWTLKECVPPACLATGNCSEILVWGVPDGP